MKKLTKLSLLLLASTAMMSNAFAEDNDKNNNAVSQLSNVSKTLSNVANDQFADKVKQAEDNTEAYKKAALTPADVVLAPAERQVVRFNQGQMPFTLDPTLTSFTPDFFSVQELFDPLVRLHRSGEVVPVAAESWETSDDGLTWTFHLRKDATWSDGKAVTAKDFLYSWRRLADPKTGAVYSFYLAELGVKNALSVIQGKAPLADLGVEAKDDYTFVVHLEKSKPWLLQTISQVNLVPLRQDVIEKYGSDWTKPGNMVNNGPYRLTEYKLNDLMLYKKRDDYWGAKDIVINTIQFDFIQNAKVGYFNYLRNVYPTASIPKDLKEQVLNERPQELLYVQAPIIEYVKVNHKNVPDVRVRKAISLLLNRQFLVNKILRSGQATTKAGPNTVAEGEAIKEQDYLTSSYEDNTRKARELLVEAGYSENKPFVMNFLGGASENARKLGVAFKAFFEHGSHGLVKFAPEYVDPKTVYDKLQSGHYDFTTSGWSADYNQISNFFNMYRCSSPQNDIHYCDPKLDKLLDEAELEKDVNKRRELYAQVNDLVVGEDAAVLPYAQSRSFILKSPALGGFSPWLMQRYVRDWFFINGKEVAPSK